MRILSEPWISSENRRIPSAKCVNHQVTYCSITMLRLWMFICKNYKTQCYDLTRKLITSSSSNTITMSKQDCWQFVQVHKTENKWKTKNCGYLHWKYLSLIGAINRRWRTVYERQNSYFQPLSYENMKIGADKTYFIAFLHGFIIQFLNTLARQSLNVFCFSEQISKIFSSGGKLKGEMNENLIKSRNTMRSSHQRVSKIKNGL